MSQNPDRLGVKEDEEKKKLDLFYWDDLDSSENEDKVDSATKKRDDPKNLNASQGSNQMSHANSVKTSSYQQIVDSFNDSLAKDTNIDPELLSYIEFSVAESIKDRTDGTSLMNASNFALNNAETEKENQKPLEFSEEFRMALAHVLKEYIVNTFGPDLESFARHAKRSVINLDDVKLISRHNQHLVSAFKVNSNFEQFFSIVGST